MIISLDLFREDGVAAISFGPNHEKTATFPCYTPWKQMMLASQEEINLFAAFLQKLIRFFADEYNEQVVYACFVVPYDFTCLQKARILEIARKSGVEKARCCRSMEYVGWKLARADEDKLCFFCRPEPDRIEFGIACMGDNVIDVSGVSGLRFVAGEEPQKFQKRLATEISLFCKETVGTWDCIDQIILVGSTPRYLVSLLESISGKKCFMMHDTVVKGLNRQLQTLVGSPGFPLVLQTQNVNLWAALGNSGEKGLLIKRYSTIPDRESIKLLVSTEKTLQIYEGNFMNPKFDTKLAAVDLSFVKEGREIECILSIEADGVMTLSVKNDRGENLLQTPLPRF